MAQRLSQIDAGRPVGIIMDHVVGLQCTICGAVYRTDEIDYVCPGHGEDGIVDVLYDYEVIQQRLSPGLLAQRARPGDQSGIWRYKPLLPVALTSPVPSLRVGGTPLYVAPRLAAHLGLRHVWIKDDSANPTASFKDRASAVAVVKAREAGARCITTASTGNAAAALAGLAANHGLEAIIFVPRSAPPAKIAQHLIYGARVFLVNGTYDDAFDLTVKAAKAFGWYNRNTAYNPYMSEGKKTAAFEICEQLTYATRLQSQPARWESPDCIFVPVGDGCIIGGIHKGLRDMLELGWISRMPRLFGIQAEGSSPLVAAFEKGLQGWEMQPSSVHTCADSISAGLPRDRNKALAAARATNGSFLAVSDEEILAAIPMLARNTGVFCEPAAAAAHAGLVKAIERGMVSRDEHAVLLLTGSGLKDIASAMRTVPQPPVIEPSLEAVQSALEIGSPTPLTLEP